MSSRSRDKKGCYDVGKATVYAIGDLEGDIILLYSFLKDNEILTDDNKWADPNVYVVQCGDQVDRSRVELKDDDLKYKDYEMLIFTRILSEISGGKFMSVIGNHEMMNCFGDFHYVHPMNVSGNMDIRKVLFDEDILRESVLKRNFIIRINSLIFSHAGISSGLLRLANELGKYDPNNIDYMIADINSRLTNQDIDELADFRIRVDVNKQSDLNNLSKFYGIGNPVSHVEGPEENRIKKCIKRTSKIGTQYHFGVLWDRNFNPKFYKGYMEFAAANPASASNIYGLYNVPKIVNGGVTYTQVIGHNNYESKPYLMQEQFIWEIHPGTNIEDGSVLQQHASLFMIDSYNRSNSIKFLTFEIDGPTILNVRLDEHIVNKTSASHAVTVALEYLEEMKENKEVFKRLIEAVDWLKPSESAVKKNQNLTSEIDEFISEINTKSRMSRSRGFDFKTTRELLEKLKNKKGMHTHRRDLLNRIKSGYRALLSRSGGWSGYTRRASTYRKPTLASIPRLPSTPRALSQSLIGEMLGLTQEEIYYIMRDQQKERTYEHPNIEFDITRDFNVPDMEYSEFRLSPRPIPALPKGDASQAIIAAYHSGSKRRSGRSKHRSYSGPR